MAQGKKAAVSRQCTEQSLTIKVLDSRASAIPRQKRTARRPPLDDTKAVQLEVIAQTIMQMGYRLSASLFGLKYNAILPETTKAESSA